jgi:hypothetical protein
MTSRDARFLRVAIPLASAVALALLTIGVLAVGVVSAATDQACRFVLDAWSHSGIILQFITVTETLPSTSAPVSDRRALLVTITCK